MLKKILDEKIKEQESASSVVTESKRPAIAIDNDPEIEMVLPMIAKEDEYSDYRIILSQLKKRNSKAFKRIVNFD
jgi:hypothetical protein